MNDDRIRVLIADDHPIVREGLSIVINSESDMTVVGEAENGPQTVEEFKKHRPDVTLLDLRMPGSDGPQVTEAIRKHFPNARIIVLTTYSGDEYIFRMLQAGAKAYLLKTAPKQILLQTIRTVHAGGKFIPQEIAARLADHIPLCDLSDRELQVLKQIVQGYSNKEIALTLNIAESTVKFHITTILSKMGVTDRTQAAMAAVQRGLIHVD